MTRDHAGKYRAKHPPGTQLDPTLAAAVMQAATDSELTCAAAFRIAEQYGAAPLAVGQTLDLLEYRIAKCQLGLFGYEPQKKIVKAAAQVDAELRSSLERSAVEGRVSCQTCWSLADELGRSRLDVAAACEALGLKITPCQLGAF